MTKKPIEVVIDPRVYSEDIGDNPEALEILKKAQQALEAASKLHTPGTPEFNAAAEELLKDILGGQASVSIVNAEDDEHSKLLGRSEPVSKH